MFNFDEVEYKQEIVSSIGLLISWPMFILI
jgi:hypothetical protein